MRESAQPVVFRHHLRARAATYGTALFRDHSVSPPSTFEPHAKVVAHELGHTLMLGHGNGLDDNAERLLRRRAGRGASTNAATPNGQQEDIDPPYRSDELGRRQNHHAAAA